MIIKEETSCKGETSVGREFRKLRRVLAITLIMVIFFGLGWGLAHGKYHDLGLAVQIIPYVKTKYYQPVSLYSLVRSYLIKGDVGQMLAELEDPYTRYLNKEQFQELLTQTEGSYGGLGIYLEYRENELIIMKPMQGTPGEKAGLIQGDKIIAINGRSTEDMPQELAVAKIKGPAGTEVTLTIERWIDGQKTVFDVKLGREAIKIPSVEWSVDRDPVIGKVGSLTIHQFSENTAADLNKALDLFEEEKVSGVLMDLRYNPGGLLTSAIEVAGQFLPKGPVVYIQHRSKAPVPYLAPPNTHQRRPLVVLVNEWSASASEIVAGAIKDQDQGTLVGETTFGKGVVQVVLPLLNGGALTITEANYLTSGGHYIHGKGIAPHILIEGVDQQKVGRDLDLEKLTPEEKERLEDQVLQELREIDERQKEKGLEVLRKKVQESITARPAA